MLAVLVLDPCTGALAALAAAVVPLGDDALESLLLVALEGSF
jgi:hypothetical protein